MAAAQSFDADEFALAAMADRLVLAEDALKPAAGKKHCAASTRAADAGLLPHMQRCTRNLGQHAHTADAMA